MSNTDCKPNAILFPYLGIAASLAGTAIGSGYGTFKAALSVFPVCVSRPEFIFKGMMPIIMAGIVGIYGLVAAVIIATGTNYPTHYYYGYACLNGGLAVGLTGLASGMCIGVAGNAAVKAMADQPKLLMGAMLILIFGEVLGLYGFITAIILTNKKANC